MIINGRTALYIPDIFKSDIVLETNKFRPNGGVNIPIAKFDTATAPKWTGSIPIDSAGL